MIASVELITKIDDYVHGRISLRDIEVWVVPNLPALLDHPNSFSGRMACAIEQTLNEVSEGLKTERSAKRYLKKYFFEEKMTWSGDSTEASMESINEPARLSFQSLVGNSVSPLANESKAGHQS